MIAGPRQRDLAVVDAGEVCCRQAPGQLACDLTRAATEIDGVADTAEMGRGVVREAADGHMAGIRG